VDEDLLGCFLLGGWGVLWGDLGGLPFDEFAVFEAGAGADEGD
jgi:hypothetical protein